MYHLYNGNVGDTMTKENVKGVLQLLFSVAIYYIVSNYFYDILNKINIHVPKDQTMWFELGKYILIALLVFLIYRSQIKGSKHRYAKNRLMSIIFSVGAFVVLVLANYVLHRIIFLFHDVGGFGFVDYFANPFTLNSIIEMTIDIIIKPFILIVLFPLGVSNIVKNATTASIVSGLLYGLIYALGLHTTIEIAFFIVLVPSLIMMLITYLYKTNNSIWMVYVSYVLYIAFGSFVLRYF